MQPNYNIYYGTGNPKVSKTVTISHNLQKVDLEHLYMVNNAETSRILSQFSEWQTVNRQLWLYLMRVLEDFENRQLIYWVGVDGEFTINEPQKLSKNWGIFKGNPGMNYEKMSRSLRYYYGRGILKKVTGGRYCYKFEYSNIMKIIRDMNPPLDKSLLPFQPPLPKNILKENSPIKENSQPSFYPTPPPTPEYYYGCLYPIIDNAYTYWPKTVLPTRVGKAQAPANPQHTRVLRSLNRYQDWSLGH